MLELVGVLMMSGAEVVRLSDADPANKIAFKLKIKNNLYMVTDKSISLCSNTQGVENENNSK